MNELVPFHFSEDGKGFEELGKPNGLRSWTEADLRVALEYQSPKTFRAVITRAMQACLTIGIPIEDNFVHAGGEYKLTRFACYLIAMNGDTKNPQVAAAQLYFAAIAETLQNHLEHSDNIERVLVRQELTDGNKSLSSTAKRHGVQNYAFFLNAGYRGMYNMDLAKLTSFKGVDPKDFMDRMSKTELAANLFRITQTEEKIKNQGLRGQQRLEHAAHEVGQKVRTTMASISGTEPEHLPLVEHIKDVKKKIKETRGA